MCAYSCVCHFICANSYVQNVLQHHRGRLLFLVLLLLAYVFVNVCARAVARWRLEGEKLHVALLNLGAYAQWNT